MTDSNGNSLDMGDDNLRPIGEILEGFEGVEGIIGGELPEGRRPEDQRRASLGVEIDDLQSQREELIRQIEQGDDSPELRERLGRITDLQIRARAERNAVDVNTSDKPE